MSDWRLRGVGMTRRWLLCGLDVVAQVSFLVMVVSLILQILFRYALQIVAPWTEELARFACIWTVFFGAAVCFEERAHIRVDALVSRITRKFFTHALALFNFIVVSGFVLAALYGSVLFLEIGWGVDSATTIPMQMGYVYLALPICLGSIVIFGILRLIEAALGAGGRIEA